ncbi:MAG: hypothetical protein L6R41_007964 [Letrouitia leprolyta]|nr:MAG: hypothetical protein L6R41_007964 [Letrouitia leprolyta]
MSDSVRKSSRATKGQHTKNFEPADTPTSKPRGKGKGSKAAKQASSEPTQPEDDGDAIIRCICGYVEEDEDDDRKMIICDSCEAWQHNECMEMSLDDNELPEQYFCEQCRPDLHQDLLAKVERGERPWEELARRREQEEQEKQARRRKGGKKGRRGRPSEAKSELKPESKPEPKQETKHEPRPDPKPEPKKANGVADIAAVPLTPVAAPELESRAEGLQKRKFPDDTPGEAKSPSQQEPQSKIRKVSSPTDPKPALPAPRRKSSVIATPSTTPAKAVAGKRDPKTAVLQMELVENISDLHSDARKKIAGALAKLFVEQTRQAQKEGAFSLPPNQSVDAFGNKLGLAVEYAIFLNFWGQSTEQSSQYPEKFRTISYNVKQNPALRNRLLTGDLSPNDFSKMSSHDMASKELQEKTAEMKRAADQQAILVEQQGPRIRRTHKGEEFVEGPESQGPTAPDSVFSAPVRRPRPDVESDVARQISPEAATAQSPQAIEAPDDVGVPIASPKAVQPLSVDTKAQPRPHITNERKSSSNFNIQDVWSSVTGPDTDTPRARQNFQQTEVENAAPPQQALGGSGDADIDRLLKDEEPEEEEPYSPTEYPTDPDAPVWRGKLAMQGVAEFNGVGKHVAGANLSAMITWAQLMSNVMNIEGRIDIDRASEYLCGLRWSQSTDVSVVAVTPVDEEDSKTAFNKLFQYFIDRKRYGVVGKNAIKDVKDTYLVPLEAGATKNPEFIELLEQCTIQAPVSERMLLITFVIRSNNPTAGQENTPRQLDAAAVASPVNANSAGHHAPNQFQAPTPVGMQPGYHGSPTPGAAYHGSPPQPQGGFQGTPPQHQHPYGMPPQHSPPQQQQTLYQNSYNGPVGMEAAKQVLGDMVHVPTVAALLNEAPNAGIAEFEIVRGLFETVPAATNNFEMLRGMLAMKLEEGSQRHG